MNANPNLFKSASISVNWRLALTGRGEEFCAPCKNFDRLQCNGMQCKSARSAESAFPLVTARNWGCHGGEFSHGSCVGNEEGGSRLAKAMADRVCGSSGGIAARNRDERAGRRSDSVFVARSNGDKQNNPLTIAVSGCGEVERKGFEPSTSALRTQRSPS